MKTLEICSSCKGKGDHRVISRETKSYKVPKFTWTFPFFHRVTREFKEVFCVDEHRMCTRCKGKGEIPLLEFSNEELTRKKSRKNLESVKEILKKGVH